METTGRYGEAFSNLVNSSEYSSLVKDSGGNSDGLGMGGHIRNSMAHAAWAILASRGGSAIGVVSEMAQSVMTSRRELLEEHGTIYIQSSGGFFGPSPTHRIIQEKSSEDLIFPDGGNIRLLQWPNGQHWYVKAGDVDIRVEGECKWPSKEEAEKALSKFLSGSL